MEGGTERGAECDLELCAAWMRARMEVEAGASVQRVVQRYAGGHW
jgi:hypothetical protein